MFYLLVNRHICCLCPRSAVAQGLTERIQGTSSFLFGWADSPLQRGLAQRRKEMGWFKKTTDLQAITPDVGAQPQKRFGLTGEPALGDKAMVNMHCYMLL